MNMIGNRFKTIRKILNKSQEQFANELSVSKQAISNIENSKSLPSISLMSKLLIDYNININYLLSGIGETFIHRKDADLNLKSSIMQEVEKFLEKRGIV
ncbi:MAG: helix-turn-helix transcriptional regulator [Candidatus Gastranaerophilales bacterium]|nr:helix-turn-helix transcriptional regulator [Candidatus Gastranaerophilales bacterium]